MTTIRGGMPTLITTVPYALGYTPQERLVIVPVRADGRVILFASIELTETVGGLPPLPRVAMEEAAAVVGLYYTAQEPWAQAVRLGDFGLPILPVWVNDGAYWTPGEGPTPYEPDPQVAAEYVVRGNPVAATRDDVFTWPEPSPEMVAAFTRWREKDYLLPKDERWAGIVTDLAKKRNPEALAYAARMYSVWPALRDALTCAYLPVGVDEVANYLFWGAERPDKGANLAGIDLLALLAVLEPDARTRSHILAWAAVLAWHANLGTTAQLILARAGTTHPITESTRLLVDTTPPAWRDHH